MQRRARRSGSPAVRRHCCYPNLVRTAPPLRPDMIFGKDKTKQWCDGSDRSVLGETAAIALPSFPTDQPGFAGRLLVRITIQRALYPIRASIDFPPIQVGWASAAAHFNSK